MKLVKGSKKVHEDYQKLVSGLSPEESLMVSMELVQDSVEQYDLSLAQPDWLLSDITQNVWLIKLNGAEIFLDFDVEFMSSEGRAEKLVSEKHRALLNTFKCWLLIQSSPMHTGYQKLAKKTVSVKLRHTLYLIDFLLLNSKAISLEKHFSLWDKDFVRVTLEKIFEQASVTKGVYETEKRLDEFLTKNIKSYSDDYLEAGFEKLIIKFDLSREAIGRYTPHHRRILGLLYSEGAIETTRKGGRFSLVKLSFLREKLFANTLYGHKVMQPKLEKYAISNEHGKALYSEFPQHPLNKRLDVGISESYFGHIKQTFYMLAGVNSLGKHIGLETAKISSACFEDIKLNALMTTAPKDTGRVPTIGAGEVLPQIRNGFEFIFKHKAVIFEAVESVLVGSIKEINQTSWKEFTEYGYKKYLSPEATDLGIEVLGYSVNEDELFKKRRENKDLFFLFNVLQGALQVIVGSTMARRMGELVELDPFEALLPKGIDPECSPSTDFNLVFDNRKSGVAYGGEIVREQLSRPILNRVASIIYQWQKFNLRVSKQGLLKNLNEVGLFTSLSSQTVAFKEGNTESFIDNFDAFCDYFETRSYVDENGVTRRLYIRQHQLRRFFAMTFYWAYGYEASETLRYFLAHTDIEHLERYVTEETSGEVLRGVQAERMIDGIRNRDISHIGELEVILKNKFGLNSVEYATYSEISEDIEDELIVLEKTHEHVVPQRYKNYEALLSGIEKLLSDGVISLKAEYATVESKDTKEMATMDLVLKYE